MKSQPWIHFLAYSLLTTVVPSALAADQDVYNRNWPQWRGPTANGVALHGNPPIEWDAEKNIKWKVKVPGKGHATPVIWEDKVFILTAVASGTPAEGDSLAAPPPPPREESGRGGNARPGRGPRRGGGRGSQPMQEHAFTTVCLDRKTGEVLWQKASRTEVPHEGHQSSNSFSSGSAITDGEHVMAFFGSRGLYCYDMEGDPVWEKDLGKMRTRNGFGEGSTPALHGNVLVVLWDTEDNSLVYAFDKRTGKELWRQSRDERTTWSTPYVLTHGGKTQVVINATTAVRSYELTTGKLLWECGGQTDNAIPSIVADQNTVYAMSGYRGNAALAIELGKSGDLTNSDSIRWKLDRGTPYVPSPLLYDGYLVFCQGNGAIVTCVDAASGEVYYSQERLSDVSGMYGSPVGVQNRIYLSGRDGTTVVLEKGKELKVLATNKLDDPIDASPAIVGNELFLRGHNFLYCIAEN